MILHQLTHDAEAGFVISAVWIIAAAFALAERLIRR
jgi:hypothetical protein